MRTTGDPLACSCALPSASKSGQRPPIQVAWREPLAKNHLPLMRHPSPSRTARPLGRAPQASTALGSLPTISSPVSVGR